MNEIHTHAAFRGDFLNVLDRIRLFGFAENGNYRVLLLVSGQSAPLALNKEQSQQTSAMENFTTTRGT